MATLVLGALVGCNGERGTSPTSQVDGQSAAAPLALTMLAKPQAISDESGTATICASLPGQRVVVGATVEVLVEMHIGPGFHLYGDVDQSGPFIPLKLKANVDDSSVAAGEPILPETTGVADGHPVYRGSLMATVPLTLISATTPHEFPLVLQVEYQACNDLVCMPPEKIVVEVPVSLTQTPPIPQGKKP